MTRLFRRRAFRFRRKSCFCTQLPDYDVTSDSGRCQLGFACPRQDRIAEMLKLQVPMDADVAGRSSQFLAALNALSVFGCMPQMIHAGVERNAIGNLR